MSILLMLLVFLFMLATVSALRALWAMKVAEELDWPNRCHVLGAGYSLGYVLMIPDLMRAVWVGQLALQPRYLIWLGIASASLALVSLMSHSHIQRTKVVKQNQRRRISDNPV